MADIGHIVIDGFKAGAIKYVVLDGYQTATAGPLIPCLASEGYGVNASLLGRVLLDGFTTNPASGGGAFYVFGDSVVR